MSEHPIRLLDRLVIKQIAAGEVVERPASVVKELLENALDAGAHAVTLDIQGGGLEHIVVTDDGCGMSYPDAQMCTRRHSTSKLATVEDLDHIATFGFRGEALSSMASVCHFRLTTRSATSQVGYQVDIQGGHLTDEREVGCPVGTSVEVRNLFFNTPARRKFMRSPATEQAHGVEAALRVMLGSRRGGLVVTAGSRRLVDIPPATSGEPSEIQEHRRVVAALGSRFEQMVPFEGGSDGIRVSGWMGSPALERTDSKGLWFFVNGRFVKDRMMQRAILDAYRSHGAPGRYPTALVYVDMASEAVDVNVHPQKLEVRFAHTQGVFRAVSQTLAVACAPGLLTSSSAASSGALSGGTLSGGALSGASDGEGMKEAPLSLRRSSGPYQVSEPPAIPYAAPASPFSVATACSPAQETMDDGSQPSGEVARLQPMGWVWEDILLCQGSSTLILIDGAAAGAYIALCKLQDQLERGEVVRYPLLFPEVLSIPPSTPSWGAWLTDHWESLHHVGFEIEPIGPEQFAVRAVPHALAEAPAQALALRCIEAVYSHRPRQPAEPHVCIQVWQSCIQHVRGALKRKLWVEQPASFLIELDRWIQRDAHPEKEVFKGMLVRWSRAELSRWFERPYSSTGV